MLISTCYPNDCAPLKRDWRTSLLISSLAVFGVFLLGCSARANSASSAGGCNNAPMGFCNEFTGSSYKAAAVQRSCEAQKLQFVPGACPAEGRVGACLVYKGKDSESNNVYYSNFPGMQHGDLANVTASAAKQCTRMKGELHPN